VTPFSALAIRKGHVLKEKLLVSRWSESPTRRKEKKKNRSSKGQGENLPFRLAPYPQKTPLLQGPFPNGKETETLLVFQAAQKIL